MQNKAIISDNTAFIQYKYYVHLLHKWRVLIPLSMQLFPDRRSNVAVVPIISVSVNGYVNMLIWCCPLTILLFSAFWFHQIPTLPNTPVHLQTRTLYTTQFAGFKHFIFINIPPIFLNSKILDIELKICSNIDIHLLPSL